MREALSGGGAARNSGRRGGGGGGGRLKGGEGDRRWLQRWCSGRL